MPRYEYHSEACNRNVTLRLSVTQHSLLAGAGAGDRVVSNIAQGLSGAQAARVFRTATCPGGPSGVWLISRGH